MKAVVTIELEINEDVLEQHEIDKAGFVKEHLVINKCVPDGAYITHDMARISDDELFTGARILSVIPTRMRKPAPAGESIKDRIVATVATFGAANKEAE